MKALMMMAIVVGSGIYLVRMTTDSFCKVQKMVLVK